MFACIFLKNPVNREPKLYTWGKLGIAILTKHSLENNLHTFCVLASPREISGSVLWVTNTQVKSTRVFQTQHLWGQSVDFLPVCHGSALPHRIWEEGFFGGGIPWSFEAACECDGLI